MSLQQLKGITANDVPRSPFSPPTNTNFYAKVVTVHDWDTCDLVFYCNGSYQRFQCRLLGINSPELTDGIIALKYRDFLAWLCLGYDPAQFPRQSQPWSEAQLQYYLNASQVLVHAEFHGVGGYGRPLVTLRSQPREPRPFNQLLMDYEYASAYMRWSTKLYGKTNR